MLEEITKNPDLAKYMTTFREGDILFLEGDVSQDLYILVSGRIDVLKGNKKIAEIRERGSLFGEMSFLLGGNRTASAKACEPVKVLCIPKEKVSDFLNEFPSVAEKITKLLAHRLDETSQALYGLREFCDQLPDAVVLTDKEGKILTWNSAAERLYGREWHEMYDRSMEDIYDEPQAYKSYIEEVQSRYSVREKILKIRHPEKGIRHISTSTTILYDGHHNFQGVLSLGRDVTAVQNLERRYRRVRNWLIPTLALLGLLGAASFFAYPYFSRGVQTVDVKKQELKNQLARDYLLLKSLLKESFLSGDRSRTNPSLNEFFKVQDSKETPYKGILLLDRDKRVFDAFYPGNRQFAKDLLGSSYAGIEFHGSDKSPHRVLTLYRADKKHPMGHRGVEVAFEMVRDRRFLGWIVFQMDMEALKRDFGAGEEDLRGFQFRKQQP
ncbi:MAG: cyclic nucleotide-binding domain-containing protein [Deltaproteobacteria bacterium]|nr:cyclic nucleotide-binding domain-containing protein [Deltaproteobacteria bacterium]